MIIESATTYLLYDAVTSEEIYGHPIQKYPQGGIYIRQLYKKSTCFIKHISRDILR